MTKKRLTKIRSLFLAAILAISTIMGPLATPASAASAVINYYSGTKDNSGNGNFISAQNRVSVMSLSSDSLKNADDVIKDQSGAGVNDVVAFQNYGYFLSGWKITNKKGKTNVYEVGDNVKLVDPGSNLTAIAQWAKKANVIINGDAVEAETTSVDNGTVILSDFPAAQGKSLGVYLNPSRGYSVKTFKVNGEDKINSITHIPIIDLAGYEIPGDAVKENVSIEVEFGKPTVTINTSAGVTATPNGTFTVNDGETKNIKLELADKYRLTSIKINGEELNVVEFEAVKAAGALVGADGVVSLVNIKKDMVVDVTAETDKYNVRTEVIGEHGTINEGAAVETGNSFTVTVTPDEHYELSSLVVTKGISDIKDVTKDVAEDGTYTIENITKDVLVTAKFTKKLEYDFVVNAGEHVNIITPLNTNKKVGYEDKELVSFRLDEGYELASIKINGKKIDNAEFEVIAVAANSLGIAAMNTLTITGDTTVEITAKIKTFLVSAINTTPLYGLVTPVLPRIVKYGDSYTLNVTPYTGYELEKVTLNGLDITKRVSDGKFTLAFDNILSTDTVFTVSFKPKTYTVTVDASEDINVDVTKATVEYLDNKIINVAPKDKYHEIESISINGKKLNAVELGLVKATGKLALPLINEDKHVVIASRVGAYDVATKALTEGGNITAGKVVRRGDDFLIKVTPDKYYEVDTFTVDGEPAKLTSGYYLLRNVNANHEVEVSFKLVKHDVRIYGDWGAIITPNRNVKVTHGDSMDYTIKAKRNYEIQSVMVNGKRQELPLNEDVLHLENVNSDTVILVSTKKVAHDVVTRVYGGHGVVSESANVKDGEAYEIVAMAEEGYKVKNIYVNGRKVEFQDNTYTIEHVKRDTIVVVTFEEYLPAITVIADENVEIEGEVPTEVTYGADLAIKINAKDGYRIVSVKVNGVEVELPLEEGTLTIGNITTDMTIEIESELIPVKAPDTGMANEANMSLAIAMTVAGAMTVLGYAVLEKKKN